MCYFIKPYETPPQFHTPSFSNISSFGIYCVNILQGQLCFRWRWTHHWFNADSNCQWLNYQWDLLNCFNWHLDNHSWSKRCRRTGTTSITKWRKGSTPKRSVSGADIDGWNKIKERRNRKRKKKKGRRRLPSCIWQ